MKQNKSIIVGIIVSLVLGLIATGYIVSQTRCTADGETVCYDKKTEMFRIEENAKILIQVESESLGEYAVKTWNELHPENEGALTYAVSEPLGIDVLSKEFPYDVMVVKQNDAAYFVDKFLDLGTDMDSIVGSKIPVQLQDTINLKGYYLVQNSITGSLFAYNETLMKELNFDTKDENKDGLPDVFETWDLIFKNADKIQEKIDVVFPLTFVDQESFYPFLTGGRWTLNLTKKGSKPGFDSREFSDGLELIELFGNVVLDKTVAIEEPKPEEVEPVDQTTKPVEVKEDTKDTKDTEKPKESESTTDSDKEEVKPKMIVKAEDLKWQYESAFFSRQSLFTIVSDFDLAKEYSESTGDVYKFAPFPKFDKHHLTPRGEVDGYVGNGETQYPSATAEAIRILRTGEAVSIFQKSTGKIPVYHRTNMEDLNIQDVEVLDKIKAYNFHDTPPVMALDNNPNRLARSLYTEVDIMEPLRKLFNKEITRDEAVKQIVQLTNDWLKENDTMKEE